MLILSIKNCLQNVDSKQVEQWVRRDWCVLACRQCAVVLCIYIV